MCSACQPPSQLAAAAAVPALPPLIRVSHSLGAHAELAVRTLRSFNWTRYGVLLDIDQYDPAVIPALDRMLPQTWVTVPHLDASALANATMSAPVNATSELGAMALRFFRSSASVDVLRLYARSLREQNAKVLLVYCGSDLLPKIWVRHE